MQPLAQSVFAYTTTGSGKVTTALKAAGVDKAPTPGNLLVLVGFIDTLTAGNGSASGGTGTWVLANDGTIDATQVTNRWKWTVWVKEAVEGDPVSGYTYTAPAGGHGGAIIFELPNTAETRKVFTTSSASTVESVQVGPINIADADNFSILTMGAQGSSFNLSDPDGFSMLATAARGAIATRAHGPDSSINPTIAWTGVSNYGGILITFSDVPVTVTQIEQTVSFASQFLINGGHVIEPGNWNLVQEAAFASGFLLVGGNSIVPETEPTPTGGPQVYLVGPNGELLPAIVTI